MKKTYVKPEIMFESFVACTNIAKCDVENPGGYAPNHCAYRVEYGPTKVYDIFTSELVGICKTTEYLGDDANDGVYNNVCYDVPVGYDALFGS